MDKSTYFFENTCQKSYFICYNILIVLSLQYYGTKITKNISIMTLYIILGLIILTTGGVIGIYNKLVKKKVLMEEGWSIIDIFLKKRYNLIPNLVESVKGYASHEKETLERVMLARSQALRAKNVAEKTETESMLSSTLGRLMVVSENYPQLRANENFMQLQQELSNLEGEIEKSRRYYNGSVREYNIVIRSFPSNIIAGMFNFDEGTFFEIDKNQREVPKVSF